MKDMSEAVNRLKNCDDVAVVCHMSPDGDAVGSSLALKRAFENLGKTCDVFCEDIPKGKLTYIKGSELFNVSEKNRYDGCVSVDCGDRGRLGSAYSILKKSAFCVNIDHHATNESFGDYNFINPKAAATAELVYDFINELSPDALDKTAAECLYCALVTDSGCFSFSSVTENTMRIAYKLLGFGIDAGAIAYHFYKKTDLNVFRLKNRILSKAEFFSDGKIGLITFCDEDFKATGTSETDTEGIINAIIDISEVSIAISMTDLGKMQYRISIRTKENADASRCAMIFGGGGHKRAAGCRIHGRFEDVKEKLLKAARDNL